LKDGSGDKSSPLERAFSAPFGELNESGEIAADIGFVLRSRPPLDTTLGRQRVGDSRVVFGVHHRHEAAAKRLATLVEPVSMFADPLVDRSPSSARIVAAVRAEQNVDRGAIHQAGSTENGVLRLWRRPRPFNRLILRAMLS
jgi:hypothetical protein